ncbi:hypothetical protein Q3G72_024827 [Acer saccharum]|nr:hypothetical protein Q3G72_024827 [Acer saccharum]
MEMEMVTSREKNGTRKLKLESTVAGSEMEFEWQMPMNQPAAAMQSDTDNMKWRSADNGNLVMFGGEDAEAQGTKVGATPSQVQVGPVVKELVGLAPKVDPINDPNIRKDHPPLVSRSSPTLMSEDLIVPSLEAGGPFKAIPTEISDEGSVPVGPWPSSEGSSLPLSQPRGPSP